MIFIHHRVLGFARRKVSKKENQSRQMTVKNYRPSATPWRGFSQGSGERSFSQADQSVLANGWQMAAKIPCVLRPRWLTDRLEF